MTDKFLPAKRSQIMANVKGRNTSPERLVKSCLRRLHCRYQGNVKTLPGTPDIVLVGKQKLIFVHGCFWHGHRACPRAVRPATNRAFWDKKIDGNMKRDSRTAGKLRRTGWSVLVVWQCQTRHTGRLERRLARFIER
jgi:DNA mismatch endonuclease (patch repair protein)